MDASVAVASALFTDARQTAAEAIIRVVAGEGALVPAIWPFEVWNVPSKQVRRRELSFSEADAALEELFQLPVAMMNGDPRGQILTESFRFAHENRLNAFDASYLHLALTTGLPLATFDGGMRSVAAARGIALFN